jgi:rare lipoprotein A (peptidoglycan hydrolase)
MKSVNNQRRLKQTLVACTLLWMCHAAIAQGLQITEQTAEPNAEKTAEVPTATVVAEEPKVEAINNNVGLVASFVGLASYYAAKFHGRRTANGEKFSSKLLTAAHSSLPFGTLLKVTNPANSKSVIVRVNDRGPYVQGRLLDLSRAAADLIGITRLGVAPVELEILEKEANP